MLRLVAVAAALALGWAALELRQLTSFDVPRPAHADRSSGTDARAHRRAHASPRPSASSVVLATGPIRLAPASPPPIAGPVAGPGPGSGLELDGGVPRTARAVRAAVEARGLEGRVWLGKMRSVGGGRDTLVYVPRALDAARTVELVVYMEGHGSFADAAMDHRHAASIARLAGNVVYVAPDAPSSAHGDRTARTAYWQRGCAERRCAGGHAAPGDFVAFLGEVRGKVAAMAGVEPGALALRVSLIGFSNGGKGVWNAVSQLAAVGFVVDGQPVALADVVFADANYGGAWLADTWRHLADRPEAPRLTILVGDGSFARADRGGGNRVRAADFWRRAAPGAAAPSTGRAVAAPRLRLVPLPANHHAIGDAAIDYLDTADRAAVGSPPSEAAGASTARAASSAVELSAR